MFNRIALSSDKQPYNEKKLLYLLSQDSQFAFQVLYDRHRDNIYGVAVKAVKSTMIAQEIVQDVFLKLWFERKKVLDFQSLENWLFVVARNLIINQLKKIARDYIQTDLQVLDESTMAEPTNLDYLDRNTYSDIHAKALAGLTTHQKQVYEMIRVQKMKTNDVASKLGVSPLTVKKHLTNALAIVRKYISGTGFKCFF